RNVSAGGAHRSAPDEAGAFLAQEARGGRSRNQQGNAEARDAHGPAVSNGRASTLPGGNRSETAWRPDRTVMVGRGKDLAKGFLARPADRTAGSPRSLR